MRLAEKTYTTLVEAATKATPAIAATINLLKCKRTSIIIDAQDKHSKKISTMQYEEVAHFHEFIRDSLKMLNKYYIYLKADNKVTKSMTVEYNDLIRKAKHAKSITWVDEQQKDDEKPDEHSKFLMNLDPSNIVSIPNLPTCDKSPESSPTHSEYSPEIVSNNVNATFEFIKPEINTTQDMFDSDEDLNTTHTLDTDSKSCIVLPDVGFNGFTRPINPSDLNSTFVLSQKHKKGEPPQRKPVKLAGVQKRILSERTNFLVGDNKSKYLNPLICTFN